MKTTIATVKNELRLAKIKPLLGEFFAWIETVPVSGKGKLSEAVRYSLNERKYLYTFLGNGDVPIDNNSEEKTGCSVTLQGVPKQVQRSIALWRQQSQTDLMFSNTLNYC